MKQRGYPRIVGSLHHVDNQWDKAYSGYVLEKRNDLFFFPIRPQGRFLSIMCYSQQLAITVSYLKMTLQPITQMKIAQLQWQLSEKAIIIYKKGL